MDCILRISVCMNERVGRRPLTRLERWKRQAMYSILEVSSLSGIHSIPLEEEEEEEEGVWHLGS